MGPSMTGVFMGKEETQTCRGGSQCEDTDIWRDACVKRSRD